MERVAQLAFPACGGMAAVFSRQLTTGIPIPNLPAPQTRHYLLRRRIIPPAAGVDAWQQVEVM